jgi:quercetin 2,3-dioxygenase
LIIVRPARERLQTRIGWLDSRHTFTYEEHIDPRYMGFRAIRVLNEDRISPGYGFGTHPHREIEILTYVLAGALRHQDSLGTESIVKPGDLQRLTTGTGVLHSEFNASATEPLHLLQIWLTPRRTRLPPRYEQRAFPARERPGRLTLVASRDGRDGSVTIEQDVAVYLALLDPQGAATHPLLPGRHAWIQVMRGAIAINGVPLGSGDGASISDELMLDLRASIESEALLLDLA